MSNADSKLVRAKARIEARLDGVYKSAERGGSWSASKRAYADGLHHAIKIIEETQGELEKHDAGLTNPPLKTPWGTYTIRSVSGMREFETYEDAAEWALGDLWAHLRENCSTPD